MYQKTPGLILFVVCLIYTDIVFKCVHGLQQTHSKRNRKSVLSQEKNFESNIAKRIIEDEERREQEHVDLALGSDHFFNTIDHMILENSNPSAFEIATKGDNPINENKGIAEEELVSKRDEGTGKRSSKNGGNILQAIGFEADTKSTSDDIDEDSNDEKSGSKSTETVNSASRDNTVESQKAKNAIDSSPKNNAIDSNAEKKAINSHAEKNVDSLPNETDLYIYPTDTSSVDRPVKKAVKSHPKKKVDLSVTMKKHKVKRNYTKSPFVELYGEQELKDAMVSFCAQYFFH